MSTPTPSWEPTTARDVEDAASRALLAESHHLDIKRELASGAGHNKEAAKDMASFAVDGGMLLYGVDESTTPPSVTPVVLAGLAERLEQIALTAVSEPLYIRTLVLPSGGDPSKGIVGVIVPPSGRAPHMVDGRYYGRGDKTKIVLSDAQVTAMHEQRVLRERAAQAVARDDLDTGPIPLDDGVLALVAQPLASHKPLLEELSSSPRWQEESLRLMLDVAGPPSDYAPTLSSATGAYRQPRGVRLSSGLDALRRVNPEGDEARNRKRVVELRLDEDGTLHLLSARAVEVRHDWPMVFEKLIIGNARHLDSLCTRVAERSGYKGAWRLSVAVGGLHGSISWELYDRMVHDGGAFTDATYEAATTASLEELVAMPDAVVTRLLAPLLRALGSQHLLG